MAPVGTRNFTLVASGMAEGGLVSGNLIVGKKTVWELIMHELDLRGPHRTPKTGLNKAQDTANI